VRGGVWASRRVLFGCCFFAAEGRGRARKKRRVAGGGFGPRKGTEDTEICRLALGEFEPRMTRMGVMLGSVEVSFQLSEPATFPVGGRGSRRAAWDRVVRQVFGSAGASPSPNRGFCRAAQDCLACVVSIRSDVICGCAEEFALSKKNRRQTGELGGDTVEFAGVL
jgi:hypothetical protein